MENFRYLELSYGSFGLSALNALRELLTTLVMAVTEERTDGPLPYAEGDTLPFETYPAISRKRLENLFHHNAFYIKDFSERTTGGTIGVTLRGSQRLPPGPFQPQEVCLSPTDTQARDPKVLYLASP